MLIESKENPIITKAPFGDIWRIEFKDTILIKNQKGLEEWLVKHNKENEGQEKS